MSKGKFSIGIFDSGVGGLTVVRAIRELIPSERIVYFGDTARVPYGNKSPETVTRYSQEISKFLLTQDVKAIVVACNTASAHALDTLEKECSVPVLGVIAPGVKAALEVTRNEHVGIIGTHGTIQSEAYQKGLKECSEDVQIFTQATPLLVPLIEENWIDHAVTQSVWEAYWAPMRECGVDTLILACTHYPLLKNVIKESVGEGVRLVDSAQNLAIALKERLEKENLSNEEKEAEHLIKIFVSDENKSFSKLAENFLSPYEFELSKVSLID